ncbi:hypothetical protein NQ315_001029 [Exocentrus adspersus]|uniref:ATP synthase subunit d, mitochondrial n=1 Tax=Exocentrus adspersus TaxID=1586481 RepID=A0AAV8WE71_9CUCU|nr:hypothetical protein NQ315_001029 [Exocentrus adspersus]
MASKRIAKSAINWSELNARVPPHQRPQYLAFKSQSDAYLRRVLANPENLPQIDWSYYQQKVPVPGMVEEFKKQYGALSIPFPPDTVSSQIDSLEKEIKNDIQKFKTESNARITEYKKQLAHLAGLIPYDQMTMEDYRDAFPEDALDPINRPTFWPHTPEEQLDYKEDKEEASSH